MKLCSRTMLVGCVCAVTLSLTAPAEGVNWIFRSVGSDMAGGTFSVTFFGPPPGAAGPGPFAAPIIAGPPGTATATITPAALFPGNTVTLMVVGDKFTTTWHITNSIQTIASVNIDLTGSLAVFDDGSLPSTPFSAAGRPYTFVPNADFAADPVAVGGAVFGLPPFKNLGDMWKDLTLSFIPGVFTTAPGTLVTLDFMTDTDKQIFNFSLETCNSPECVPSGACCLADGCVEATEQECIDSGLGVFQGLGTTCGPIQGCCFSDGTCRDMSPVCCTAAGGTPSGPGSVCLGDNNGNGVDDACEGLVFVPAVSDYGLVALLLLTAAAGVIVIRRARRGHAAG